MPKYRNEKRLEEIIASGKALTALSRRLILQGESWEVASKGLEPYVSDWEQSVKSTGCREGCAPQAPAG